MNDNIVHPEDDGSELLNPDKTPFSAWQRYAHFDFIKTKYQSDRKQMYPLVEEQLDMIYWDKKNGTDVWSETIESIKMENPKP